jgi:hypothetical protein
MTTLKSLTFTTVPKIGANPTLDRRAKVIERLEEQKLLLNDPTPAKSGAISVGAPMNNPAEAGLKPS